MDNIITSYMEETLEEYIQEKGRTEWDYYQAFLVKTDYIPNKLVECNFLGIECDDYSAEIAARQYARDKINEYNNAL